jgi:DNA helicase-2/ATP-dependent DNA helicase PcrA
MSTELFASLTPAQREAVEHVDGPLLILAGPGSGKTRVVTHRVAHLLSRGIPASQILALTFTNKAADEMRLRLARLAARQSVWMGTFHRFCAQLLRRHADLAGLSENYTIYDVEDSRQALLRALEDIHVELSHTSPEAVARGISWAKNRLIGPEQYEGRLGSPLGSIVEKVYPAYQRRLLAANAVDFDDLLLHTGRLLQENAELRRQLDARYRYILVDEYQDTNLAQYAIVRALSVEYPNLAATGDPDQSIYGWRGADLNNILDFERDFANVKVVRLEQNYRSTKRILRVADALIEHNVRRKKKSLFTDNDEGPPVRLVVYPTQRDEAHEIARRIAEAAASGRRRPRDFAIFYRINALSRTFETALAELGVPYQIVGGVEFYRRKEIKDVLAYMQLVNNPRDDVAFERVVNAPTRGIGRSSLTRLRKHAVGRRASLLEAARQAGLVDGLPKRAAVQIAKFVALIDRLAVHAHGPVEELLGYVLTETGYAEKLRAADTPEDDERLANIQELLSASREFDAENPGDGRVERFLEQVALVNETDNWESENDHVTLMTLHAAKGLEFPVVFITAVEEGLLPHSRTAESESAQEEERRLLFVGITRAEEELQLSYCRRRMFRGQQVLPSASPFLMDIPRDEFEIVQAEGASIVACAEHADAYDQAARHELDEPHDDDVPPAGKRRERGGASNRQVATPRVTTAADLLTGGERAAGAAARPTLSPEEFAQGMIVAHPGYGLGRIVALSGEGAKRTATVQFFSSKGLKKFRIVHSPLAPVKSAGA